LIDTHGQPGAPPRPPIPTRWAAAAIAIFGAVLIAGLWIATMRLARSEAAATVAAEFSKNNNLALALDVQTNQLLHGIDQFLILIDMTMPVMGGVEAIRELARLDPTVRIIAASGIHENEMEAKGAGPQVRQFLAKPFSTDTVLRVIDRVVER
jgi:CheY-like chemotaxis protein